MKNEDCFILLNCQNLERIEVKKETLEEIERTKIERTKNCPLCNAFGHDGYWQCSHHRVCTTIDCYFDDEDEKIGDENVDFDYLYDVKASFRFDAFGRVGLFIEPTKAKHEYYSFINPQPLFIEFGCVDVGTFCSFYVRNEHGQTRISETSAFYRQIYNIYVDVVLEMIDVPPSLEDDPTVLTVEDLDSDFDVNTIYVNDDKKQVFYVIDEHHVKDLTKHLPLWLSLI